MALYILIVLIFCIFTILATSRRVGIVGGGTGFVRVGKRNIDYQILNNVIIFIVLFAMWFLTAFRAAKIGNDTQTYLNLFERINKTGISNDTRFEYGFQALCVFIGLFTDDAQWLLIVYATFCYVGVGAYILIYSKNSIVSVVIFFCLYFSLFATAIRQDIALVFGLYAYHAIKHKKHIRALLLIGLAVAFHKSAAVMLLLFFHKLFKFNFKTVFVITLLLIALGMSGVVENIVETFAVQYSVYFDGKYARSGWLAVSVAVFRAAVFCWFMYKAYGDGKNKNSVVLASFTLLLWVSGLGYIVNLFTRAAEYFLLPAIIELPNAFETKKIKNGKLWLAVTVVWMLAYFLITLILRPEWNNLYPYGFFWAEVS